MRYLFIALTMSLMAASYAFSDEPSNDGADQAAIDPSANIDNNNVNLQEGNSSNWGWWNVGARYAYPYFGYGYNYGYGRGYGYGCGSYPEYYTGCGGYTNYYSWGFYNPNYLYRVAPMVR